MRSLLKVVRRLHSQQRNLTVLAWGRNAEGQCGQTSSSPFVAEPAPVSGLDDAVAVAAGRQHCAAVTGEGHLLTWGEGASGKLGHGNAEDLSTPTRVESMVHRVEVQAMALGHSHSLFLDADGAVYACGENKEGQCGYGTSLETIAAQRRQEWAIGANLAAFAGAAGAMADAAEHQVVPAGGGGLSAGPSGWQHQAQMQEAVSASAVGQGFIRQLDEHTERQAEVDEARRMFAAGVSMREMDPSTSFGAFVSGAPSPTERTGRKPGSVAAIMGHFSRARGLMPGQFATPTRLSRDSHPLLSGGGPPGDSPTQADEPPVFTSIAASRYFSAATTTAGQVFTWGSGFSGELGFDGHSWVTVAREVDGVIREAIADNGGASKVVTGSGGFCACLTSSGRVVVWGKLPGLPMPQHARRSGGVCVTEVMGLPPMIDVSAGHSHLLMTDGERCFAMGSWLDGMSDSKTRIEWGIPCEQMRAPDAGISQVSAGSQASAVVTGDGQLWLWGRLLSVDNARALVAQHGEPADMAGKLDEWASWPGMGSNQPQEVPGLPPLKSVHLGAAFALAVEA